jgi:O-antigen/teichoic acid export membrane protein
MRLRLLDGSRRQQAWLHLLASQVLLAAGALGFGALSSRALGPSGRGQLALFLTIGYIVTLVILGPLERSLPAVAQDLTGSLRAAVRGSLRLRRWAVVSATGLTAVVALVWGMVEPTLAALEAVWWWVLLILFTLLHSTQRLVRAASIATSSSMTFFLLTGVSQMALLVGGVALWRASIDDVTAWVGAYLGASGIFAIWAFTGPAASGWRQWEEILPTMGRDRDLFASSLAHHMTLRADRLAIPLISTSAELGYYVAAATMTEMSTWPIANFVDGKVAQWRRRFAARGSGTKLLLSVAAMAFLVTAGIGLLAYWAIVPLFGSAFAPARRLVLPLSAAAWFYCGARAMGGLAVARGRSRSVVAGETSGLVIAILLYSLLIPKHGAAGAAWASVAAYSAVAVVTWLLIQADLKGATAYRVRLRRTLKGP